MGGSVDVWKLIVVQLRIRPLGLISNHISVVCISQVRISAPQCDSDHSSIFVVMVGDCGEGWSCVSGVVGWCCWECGGD